MSVFDELNGLASPVEAIVPIFLVTQIVSNDSGDQLVEVGASVLADLQNGFVYGARQENCRDQSTPTAASDFHPSNFEIPQSRSESLRGKSEFQFGDYMTVFSRIGKNLI